MPALFINLRIQDEEKFNLFKTTLADLAGFFSECYVKFRGFYRDQCVEFTREIFNSINHYAKKLHFNLCFYSLSSPFNLEKTWFETEFIDCPLVSIVVNNYNNDDDDFNVLVETTV